MKFDEERLAGVTFFVQEEGGAGGEAAQGVGKARANGAGVSIGAEKSNWILYNFSWKN